MGECTQKMVASRELASDRDTSQKTVGVWYILSAHVGDKLRGRHTSNHRITIAINDLVHF